MEENIAAAFERSFMNAELAEQVAQCAQYELAPLFADLFRTHQPVLEAGCGSGRWCAWMASQGIRCDGVDWSEALCDRARRAIPESRFVACDMRRTPFADGAYGGVLALGSIEHSAEGPTEALREFCRLLRPGGVAVITVPYGGRLRTFMRFLGKPILWLRASPLVRRLLGRGSPGRSLRQARATTVRVWHPRFQRGSDGWFFYEYEFNKPQMRRFLGEVRLEVMREFTAFGDEGILHNFGRLAGRWNAQRAGVDFTLIGRLLRRLVPVSVMGHMLCYVVTRAAPTSVPA